VEKEIKRLETLVKYLEASIANLFGKIKQRDLIIIRLREKLSASKH